jgi:hypothetical protein
MVYMSNHAPLFFTHAHTPKHMTNLPPRFSLIRQNQMRGYMPYCLWFCHGGRHVFFMIFWPAGYLPVKADRSAPRRTVWRRGCLEGSIPQPKKKKKKWTRSHGELPVVSPVTLHHSGITQVRANKSWWCLFNKEVKSWDSTTWLRIWQFQTLAYMRYVQKHLLAAWTVCFLRVMIGGFLNEGVKTYSIYGTAVAS